MNGLYIFLVIFVLLIIAGALIYIFVIHKSSGGGGTPGDLGSQCGATLPPCSSNLTCDIVVGTCQVSNGQTCDPTKDECVTGSTCTNDKCTAPAAGDFGAPCSASQECTAKDTVCSTINGVCLFANGATTTNANFCVSGLINAGTCVPRSNGQSCTQDAQCATACSATSKTCSTSSGGGQACDVCSVTEPCDSSQRLGCMSDKCYPQTAILNNTCTVFNDQSCSASLTGFCLNPTVCTNIGSDSFVCLNQEYNPNSCITDPSICFPGYTCTDTECLAPTQQPCAINSDCTSGNCDTSMGYWFSQSNTTQQWVSAGTTAPNQFTRIVTIPAPDGRTFGFAPLLGTFLISIGQSTNNQQQTPGQVSVSTIPTVNATISVGNTGGVQTSYVIQDIAGGFITGTSAFLALVTPTMEFSSDTRLVVIPQDGSTLPYYFPTLPVNGTQTSTGYVYSNTDTSTHLALAALDFNATGDVIVTDQSGNVYIKPAAQKYFIPVILVYPGSISPFVREVLPSYLPRFYQGVSCSNCLSYSSFSVVNGNPANPQDTGDTNTQALWVYPPSTTLKQAQIIQPIVVEPNPNTFNIFPQNIPPNVRIANIPYYIIIPIGKNNRIYMSMQLSGQSSETMQIMQIDGGLQNSLPGHFGPNVIYLFNGANLYIVDGRCN